MDTVATLALLVTCLPLLAFTVQIFAGARLPRKGDFIPLAAVGAGLLISAWLLVTKVLAAPHGMEPVSVTATWIELSPSFRISAGILVDNLTVVMLFVVTLVSFLVHLYSTGYMHDDPRYPRFFAYLALFTFSMLGLVITNNMLLLYMFWELVGLCSYFLIGFWFEKASAASAAKKAFLTNRIGDTGFFIGLMAVFTVTGSFAFTDIFESVRNAGGVWGDLLPFAGIMIFLGCVSKSAQFPLHVWLPDAMEGPTPVSALIHAATMVAAGVYMIVRMFPLLAGAGYMEGNYFDSPALWVVAGTGAFTALFAATIALAQTDIKKVLAYSTVSQLGYMVMAVGVGSLTAAMYHLFTHAMFKACLFLGSGSVIHAVHTQEMPEMGGLRRKMPITFWTFLLSTLAIAGVPLFSGFVSKEAVLTQALAFWNHHGTAASSVPFLLCAAAAFLTAFYMFRIIFLTFTGKPRDHHRFDHAHESPPAMTIPLIVLAVLGVLGAGIALPGGPGTGWFPARVNNEVLVGGLMTAPSTGDAATRRIWSETASWHALESGGHGEARTAVVEHFAEAHHAAHVPTMAVSIAVAGLGILFSWWVFSKNVGRDFVGRAGFLAAWRRVLLNLYYVDWFYLNGPVRLVRILMGAMRAFDRHVIDAFVNLWGVVTRGVAFLAGRADAEGVDGAVRGTGETVLLAGEAMRRVQTGRIQDYVRLTVFSMALIAVIALAAARWL